MELMYIIGKVFLVILGVVIYVAGTGLCFFVSAEDEERAKRAKTQKDQSKYGLRSGLWAITGVVLVILGLSTIIGLMIYYGG